METELTIMERLMPECVLLDLRGQLTRQSEQLLLEWREWERGLDGPSALALNFGEVTVINSAGIALLIRLAQSAQKAGFALYAFGINAHYRKMFRLIGLTEFLLIYPDEPSLLQFLRSSRPL